MRFLPLNPMSDVLLSAYQETPFLCPWFSLETQPKTTFKLYSGFYSSTRDRDLPAHELALLWPLLPNTSLMFSPPPSLASACGLWTPQIKGLMPRSKEYTFWTKEKGLNMDEWAAFPHPSLFAQLWWTLAEVKTVFQTLLYYLYFHYYLSALWNMFSTWLRE